MALVLAIISMSYDNIAHAKVIAEIWEDGDIATVSLISSLFFSKQCPITV